jgi:hypothetical protein
MFNIPSHKGNEVQNHIRTVPHSSQNGYHQEHKQQQMSRMQGAGGRNLHILLVGM